MPDDDIKIDGPRRRPFKIGIVRTVNIATGEVVAERKNAFTMLPTAPGVCQECAVDHPHDRPHDKQSLAYQYSFHATHGRWPTWTDAMAHCSPEVREQWRVRLIEVMEGRGVAIPEDLLESRPAGR